ncbi:MAG: hypothetical protein ABSE22_19780 [Xanthobacteraceae bacterium]
MKNKGDLSTWWYWELLREEKKWGPYAMQAEGMRAEIKRRNDLYKVIATWIGAVAGIVAIIAGLIHFF